MKNVSRRVAVMSCEPDSQTSMTFRGRPRPNREIVSIRLKELGLEPVIHRPIKDINDFPALGECGAVVMGGSKLYIFDKDLAKHEWMRKLLDFTREMHDRVPILGLCFGHQVVGRAFGSGLKLYGPEIGGEWGFVPVRLTTEGQGDLLFKGLPKRFEALFAHLSYIDTVPENGVALLMPDDQANPSIQGFRIGKTTWGVQYHPEYPPEGVREAVLRMRAELEDKMDMGKTLKALERNVRRRQDNIVLKNFADFLYRN